MKYQADFLDGIIKFEEIPSHIPCPKEKQSAMFIDRPDLWRKPIKKRKGNPKSKPKRMI